MGKELEDAELELISTSMGVPLGKIKKELNIDRLTNSTHSSKDKINVFDFIFSLNYLADSGGLYGMFHYEIKFIIEKIVSENPAQTHLWYLFGKIPTSNPSVFWSSLSESIIDKLIKNDPEAINIIFESLHKESPLYKKYYYLKVEYAFAYKVK